MTTIAPAAPLRISTQAVDITGDSSPLKPKPAVLTRDLAPFTPGPIARIWFDLRNPDFSNRHPSLFSSALGYRAEHTNPLARDSLPTMLSPQLRLEMPSRVFFETFDAISAKYALSPDTIEHAVLGMHLKQAPGSLLTDQPVTILDKITYTASPEARQRLIHTFLLDELATNPQLRNEIMGKAGSLRNGGAAAISNILSFGISEIFMRSMGVSTDYSYPMNIILGGLIDIPLDRGAQMLANRLGGQTIAGALVDSIDISVNGGITTAVINSRSKLPGALYEAMVKSFFPQDVALYKTILSGGVHVTKQIFTAPFHMGSDMLIADQANRLLEEIFGKEYAGKAIIEPALFMARGTVDAFTKGGMTNWILNSPIGKLVGAASQVYVASFISDLTVSTNNMINHGSDASSVASRESMIGDAYFGSSHPIAQLLRENNLFVSWLDKAAAVSTWEAAYSTANNDNLNLPDRVSLEGIRAEIAFQRWVTGTRGAEQLKEIIFKAVAFDKINANDPEQLATVLESDWLQAASIPGWLRHYSEAAENIGLYDALRNLHSVRADSAAAKELSGHWKSSFLETPKEEMKDGDPILKSETNLMQTLGGKSKIISARTEAVSSMLLNLQLLLEKHSFTAMHLKAFTDLMREAEVPYEGNTKIPPILRDAKATLRIIKWAIDNGIVNESAEFTPSEGYYKAWEWQVRATMLNGDSEQIQKIRAMVTEKSLALEIEMVRGDSDPHRIRQLATEISLANPELVYGLGSRAAQRIRSTLRSAENKHHEIISENKQQSLPEYSLFDPLAKSAKKISAEFWITRAQVMLAKDVEAQSSEQKHYKHLPPDTGELAIRARMSPGKRKPEPDSGSSLPRERSWQEVAQENLAEYAPHDNASSVNIIERYYNGLAWDVAAESSQTLQELQLHAQSLDLQSQWQQLSEAMNFDVGSISGREIYEATTYSAIQECIVLYGADQCMASRDLTADLEYVEQQKAALNPGTMRATVGSAAESLRHAVSIDPGLAVKYRLDPNTGSPKDIESFSRLVEPEFQYQKMKFSEDVLMARSAGDFDQIERVAPDAIPTELQETLMDDAKVLRKSISDRLAVTWLESISKGANIYKTIADLQIKLHSTPEGQELARDIQEYVLIHRRGQFRDKSALADAILRADGSISLENNAIAWLNDIARSNTPEVIYSIRKQIDTLSTDTSGYRDSLRLQVLRLEFFQTTEWDTENTYRILESAKGLASYATDSKMIDEISKTIVRINERHADWKTTHKVEVAMHGIIEGLFGFNPGELLFRSLRSMVHAE